MLLNTKCPLFGFYAALCNFFAKDFPSDQRVPISHFEMSTVRKKRFANLRGFPLCFRKFASKISFFMFLVSVNLTSTFGYFSKIVLLHKRNTFLFLNFERGADLGLSGVLNVDFTSVNSLYQGLIFKANSSYVQLLRHGFTCH